MPAEDRGDADPGLGPHQLPDEPSPRGATLGRRQLVDLDELDPGQLDDDELRDPHPRLDGERLARGRC